MLKARFHLQQKTGGDFIVVGHVVWEGKAGRRVVQPPSGVNPITVHLPPLRERIADVRALAEHFLSDSAREFGRRFQAIAPETARLLERYRWPGNVRELRAVIARATLLHDDTALRPAHLPRRAAGCGAGAGRGRRR